MRPELPHYHHGFETFYLVDGRYYINTSLGRVEVVIEGNRIQNKKELYKAFREKL